LVAVAVLVLLVVCVTRGCDSGWGRFGPESPGVLDAERMFGEHVCGEQPFVD
jgi:hypothetical protein